MQKENKLVKKNCIIHLVSKGKVNEMKLGLNEKVKEIISD